MSKRRRASELMFNNKYGLQFPVRVVATLSGTGTVAAKGVFTILAGSGGDGTTQSAYLTVSAGTNIGTLVGTYSASS